VTNTESIPRYYEVH